MQFFNIEMLYFIISIRVDPLFALFFFVFLVNRIEYHYLIIGLGYSR